MLQCDSIFKIKKKEIKGHVLYYFHKDHTVLQDLSYVQCCIERRKAVSSYMRRRDAVFTVFQETIEIVCTVNYILLANNR